MAADRAATQGASRARHTPATLRTSRTSLSDPMTSPMRPTQTPTRVSSACPPPSTRPTPFVVIAISLSLGIALLGSAAQAQIPPAVTLENTRLAVDFVTVSNAPDPGSRVDLVSMQRKIQALPLPAAMTMAPGSGGWTVRLTLKHLEPVGPGDCTGVGLPLEWFDFSSDGSTDRWNTNDPSPLGSLDALSLDSVVVEPFGPFDDRMLVRWTGRVTLEGNSSDFSVDTLWDMRTGIGFVETGLAFRLTSPGPHDFYASQVLHPSVGVDSLQSASHPTDTLLVPWKVGSLVINPTDENLPFAGHLISGSNYFPLNIAAYYDDSVDDNCFVYTASDADDYWKDLWLGVSGPTGARRMDFRMRHVPADVFDSTDYAMPYTMRLGVIQGDWWDVARLYQQFLETEVPWYEGPVGSPANTMPAAVKELVAEVILQPGYAGDHMDILNRQMMDISRVLGSNVNSIWYGAYLPDSFDQWYYNGGYLPGRPSFAAAVREGQKQFDHIVSPYVFSSVAADYLDPLLVNPPPPSQDLLDAHDSFLLDEELEEIYFCSASNGAPRQAFLCPGADWWQDEFPSYIADVGSFTRMKGVYLDFFLTAVCYSMDHAPQGAGDPHGHLSGGGNWMNTHRMLQVADLKAQMSAQGTELVVGMEGRNGRFTEEVHIMHVDPTRSVMYDEFLPGTNDPKPMDNAVNVPFFRATYDNVKLSRITTTVPSLAGRRAWTEASNVFTFGMLPSITQPYAEWIPVFSQRFAYTAFYKFFGNQLAGGTTNAAIPGPELPNTDVFVPPQKDSLNSPFFRFMRTLAATIRDHEFSIWFCGSIRRLPSMLVTVPPGFTGVPGLEIDPAPPQTSTPTYIEEPVTPGMFQAPQDIPGADAGSLAFVLANPWVDPSQTANFPVDFVFAPSDYPSWDNSTQYSVTRYDADGLVLPLPGVFTGPLPLSHTVVTGEVTWWVFRKQ
jgi:hypothetical protein